MEAPYMQYPGLAIIGYYIVECYDITSPFFPRIFATRFFLFIFYMTMSGQARSLASLGRHASESD